MIRILRLRSYFFPENVAASHLTDDLENALATNGFYTINYAPTPSRGITEEDRQKYKKIKNETFKSGKVIVHRFPMFRESNRSIQRGFRYGLCTIIEYFLGIKEKNIDVVFSSSTPPTQGMLSAKVAKKLSKRYGKRVPFVFNLQDVFPDSLVNAGMTKRGSIIWKIGRRIEDYTYRHADKIIVISEGFKRNIIEKGVPADKIEVVSNWVDLSNIHPVERRYNKLFDELGIDRSKFIVVYAGNIGEAQGADVIIDAAKQVSNISDIQFVIFGGGVKLQELINRVKEERITNVNITCLQSQERVSEVYSMGNIALITCKPGTGSAGLPSKTWSIMACNTPIIASFDRESDLAEALGEASAGYCVEPGNAISLAEAIEIEYKERESLNPKLVNSREYALNHASKEMCVQKYIEVIQKVYRENKVNE